MSQRENIETSNGYILQTSYVPEELLIQILSYVDCMQLVACHLVCKQWNRIIKENVWRRKAEIVCGKLPLLGEKTSWNTYFFICNKKLFRRNLLESNSVKVFYDEEEDTCQFVKDPHENILPLPEDLEFAENVNCIKVIYDSLLSAKRKFVVDLIKEGFTDYILDNLQPTIEVSEWYCTVPEEEKAVYESSIKLLEGIDDKEEYNRVMRVHHFHKRLNSPDKRGKWFKFTHVFKNYGPGLRRIKFYDGGHNNIIVAGPSVMMTMPSKKNVLS